ncbi:MAG: hypothetical protein CMN30_14970 [Sandaracinus sp.]|nr:hypothetical protein [Sandaracinus sp.]
MATLFGYSDPATQAWMILDAVRTDAYAEAIAATVGPDDVVLDIGSGSGVLALLAAKAGAKKVYALEMGSAKHLLRAHVQENGWADVIEIVEGNLRDAPPMDPKPTVILAEMLGHFAPQERMHALYAIARDRLAAPGARMIPGRYRLSFGLAHLESLQADVDRLHDVHGVRFGYLTDRLLARPTLTRVSADAMVSGEAGTEWVACDGPRPTTYEVSVPVVRSAPVNAIVVSWEAELAPGVMLGTRPGDPVTHWVQLVLPLHPALEVHEGERAQIVFNPRILTDRGSYAWRLRVGDRDVGGDAMNSMVGGNDLATVAARMGLTLKQPERFDATVDLEAWRAALAEGVEGVTISDLAQRVLDAQPGRFASLDDARQCAMGLLRAAEAL